MSSTLLAAQDSGSLIGMQQLVDVTALARIRSLELRARVIVEGLWRGLHRSQRHGFSVEFAEYRPYTKGDDLRFMDWKVAARSDRYFIKKFEDETQLPCQILVDRSASMNYGSDPAWKKSTYAATLSATLALFLLRQGDAVGVTTFSQRLVDHLPAGARSGQLQRALTLLERPVAAESTSLAASLDQITSLLRRRGLVVLLSDFLAPLEHLRQQLSWITARRHELVVMHVVDAQEMEFRFVRPVHFTDAETNAEVFVNPEAQRESYLSRHSAHLAAVRAACESLGATHLLCRTDAPIGETLVKLLTRPA
jgi:uncharacterized protein (DUF58 family)